VNKAKAAQHHQGIGIRKAENGRKKAVKVIESQGEFIRTKLPISIREP